MSTPEQLAWAIHLGKDEAARSELEKMWDRPFEKMTVEQRRLGVAVLAGSEDWPNSWRKERTGNDRSGNVG